MDLNSSPRTRKRGRPLHQQLNSSSPVASPTPLSAVKRRKLDFNGSSPSTPKALQVLKSAIGGVFGYGKAKEISNGVEPQETESEISKDTDGATAVFHEFIDELLAEENQDRDINGYKHNSDPQAAEHLVRDQSGDSGSRTSGTRRKSGRRTGNSISTQGFGSAEDADELLNDENHLESINGQERRKRNFQRENISTEQGGLITTPNVRSGQKRKVSRASAVTPDAEMEEDELSAVVEQRLSSNRGAAVVGPAEQFAKRNLKWSTQPEPTDTSSLDNAEDKRELSVNEEPQSGSANRPSRERRRPRRYSNEMLGEFYLNTKADATPSKTPNSQSILKSGKKPQPSNTSTPTKRSEALGVTTQNGKPRSESKISPRSKSVTKSILTPSKKDRGRPRKSVTFGMKSHVLDDEDLDVPDTPYKGESEEGSSSVKKKRGRPKRTPDPELAFDISPPHRQGRIEDDTSIIKDKSRSSTRQKADATPLRKPKSAPREALVEEVTPVEVKSPRTAELRLRSPKKRINTPTQKASAKSAAKPSFLEDEADAASDDITCVICGGGDSEIQNEILLCDNCDLAAHQVCYEVQVIPEGDWLCRDCRPEEYEELMLVDTGTVSEPSLDLEASTIPEIESFEYHMQVMQKLVLDKLTGQRRLKLYGLDEEYRKVHQVIEQTVLAGEGNSMLVIGARGCGKTTLVESVMSDLSKDHREHFHIIRLNGFIHTDDKLALREIWRQLGREMEVDDDLTSKTNNYADTLASLLALLSHPSEISEVESNQTAKSVIFILDEFDLFTSHPRQTLLYNLFDIAQARKAPIAVLGLTTKIDVVERLEKRVKSRFSHRYVHLPLPKNLATYWELCRQGLLVEDNELEEEGFGIGLGGQGEFRSFWESMINDLYNKDEVFKQQLQIQYYRSKSVSAFLTSCILPIANLSPNSIPLTGASFFFSLPTLSPPDSKLHLLQSLAELDLALIISAARLNIILDTENCNFAMAYDEYCGLTSKHKIQTSSTGIAALGAATKVWGREVAMGAWERLVECELLVSAGLGGAGNLGREGGREVKMYKVDVALDEIPGSVEGLSNIMAKWCREI